MDDLARIVFPGNRNHQVAFLAIWIEIKYAEDQFLPSGTDLVGQYGVTLRTLEIVRARMKKLGLVRRVSHFDPSRGHRSGWVFSGKFRGCLADLAGAIKTAEAPATDSRNEQKDRNSLLYI